MIHLNLLPEELRKKEAPKFVLPEIPIRKTLIVTACALLALQALFLLAAFGLSVAAAAVRAEVDGLVASSRDTARHKEETQKVEKRLHSIGQVTAREFYWASLFGALTQAMTKGVWLRSLSVERSERLREGPASASGGGEVMEKCHSLKLEGSVLAPGQETVHIGKFVKSVKQNEMLAALFDDVEIFNITQRKVKDYDVYDFVVLCRFKKGKFEPKATPSGT